MSLCSCHLQHAPAKALDSAGMVPRLYEYIAGILKRRKCFLILGGGIEDHVHLLISLSREASVAEVVRDVKAGSSGWIHKTIADARLFAWQDGYSAFSVSKSALEDVKNYIANQEEHHRVCSFHDELIAFLNKHDVEYNEDYIEG
ncbi:transposase [Bremerella cremea]